MLYNGAKLQDLLRMRGIRHSVVQVDEPRQRSLPQIQEPRARSLSPTQIVSDAQFSPVVEKPTRHQVVSIAETKKHL